MNPVSPQLQTQAFVKSLHRELGGAIQGVRGNSAKPGQAAHGDERSPALLDVRHGEIGSEQGSEKIDADDVFHRVQVGVLEVRSHGQAGGTEQNV